jgi:uncharacterized protein DUF6538
VDFIQRSRHGTVYHFRRRVPRDLAARYGRGQIIVSLQTELRAVALRRARALAAATDTLFRKRLGKASCPDALLQFSVVAGVQL